MVPSSYYQGKVTFLTYEKKPGVAGWRLKPARRGSRRLALDPSTSALCAYAQDDTLGKAEARGRHSLFFNLPGNTAHSSRRGLS
jgi:hypothetical protein